VAHVEHLLLEVRQCLTGVRGAHPCRGAEDRGALRGGESGGRVLGVVRRRIDVGVGQRVAQGGTDDDLRRVFGASLGSVLPSTSRELLGAGAAGLADAADRLNDRLRRLQG
jgi:orotidine-5'-phosphate decarboxylase